MDRTADDGADKRERRQQSRDALPLRAFSKQQYFGPGDGLLNTGRVWDYCVPKPKTLQTPYQFSLTPYGRTLKKPKTHRVRGFLKRHRHIWRLAELDVLEGARAVLEEPSAHVGHRVAAPFYRLAEHVVGNVRKQVMHDGDKHVRCEIVCVLREQQVFARAHAALWAFKNTLKGWVLGFLGSSLQGLAKIDRGFGGFWVFSMICTTILRELSISSFTKLICCFWFSFWVGFRFRFASWRNNAMSRSMRL